MVPVASAPPAPVAPAPVAPAPTTSPLTTPASDIRPEVARPWRTVVWNDPVNFQDYVAYVFRSYFGYSAAKARALMLKIHHEGRAVVSSGSRERMEADVEAMHRYGLWATLEQET